MKRKFHLFQNIINEMPKVTHLICMTDGHTLASSDFPSHIKVLSFNEVEMSGALPENSEYLINPFKPNGISHRYQLDQSISVLRVVGCYFSFLSKI